MTTPDPAAIETIAGVLRWYALEPDGVVDEAAAAAYAAMEPHIRKTVAEEIAAAIEARSVQPLGPGAMAQWGGLQDAAAIAREHGEATP